MATPPGSGVTLTLHPFGDITTPPGMTVREIREHAARLCASPSLAALPLACAGSLLDDTHPVGTPPLVTGATLTTNTSPQPNPLLAPHHVAVLDGPHTGELRLISHPDNQVRSWRLPGRKRRLITMPRIGWRLSISTPNRRTPKRRRFALVTPGAHLHLEHRRTEQHTTLHLRDAPTPTEWLLPHILTATPSTQEPITTLLLTALLPAVSGTILAVAFNRWIFALIALVGAVAILIPQLIRRRRTSTTNSAQRPLLAHRAPTTTDIALHPADIATLAAMHHNLTTPLNTDLTVDDLPPQLSGIIAITGSLHLARGYSNRLALAHLTTNHHGGNILGSAAPWHWARWLNITPLPKDTVHIPPSSLLIIDAATHPLDAATTHLVTTRHLGQLVLVVGANPSWAHRHIHVTNHETQWNEPHQPQRNHPCETLNTTTAERTARALAPLLPHSATPELPAAAPLITTPDPHPTATWGTTSPAHLRIPIGLGTTGQPLIVDLVDHGPHTLIAGTTGAGKSELLQTITTQLARHYSPNDVTLALVDYKGGAGFGDTVDLPHVVGMVTDLEPDSTTRAITGLRAELRRREHLFAGAHVTDYTSYRTITGHPLPRLVIIVDELRAFTEDHPTFIPSLVRIAAQGRSLGIHLILATQRPAGAITADMKANLSLRICLRVSDPADSHDILDAPHAATIAHTTPGRAYVRIGSQLTEVQTFYAHSQQETHTSTIRWAHTPPTTTPLPDPLPRIIRDLTTAAHSLPRPQRPWSDPLPIQVPLSELLNGTASAGPTDASASQPHAAPSALPCALLDDPGTQRHRGIGLPRGESLLITGAAQRGKSTALRTLAHSALHAGIPVHLIAPPASMPTFHTTFASAAALGGTMASTEHPHLIDLLATHLMADDNSTPPLLLIDDLLTVRENLDTTARHRGWTSITDLLHNAAARGITVAVSAHQQLPTSLATLFTHTATLLSTDDARDRFAGVPAAHAGQGTHPGRVYWHSSHDTGIAQFATVPVHQPATLPVTSEETGLNTGGIGGIEHGKDSNHGANPRHQLRLPVRCGPLTPPLLGVSAPYNDAFTTPPGSWVVIGGRRSGRTTTLRAIAAASSNPLWITSTTSRDTIRDATDQLAPYGRVLIDDYDRIMPPTQQAVDALVDSALAQGIDVVVAATTDPAHALPSSALRRVGQLGCGFLLRPDPGQREFLSVPIQGVRDGLCSQPGRGVRVWDGEATLVNISAPLLAGAAHPGESGDLRGEQQHKHQHTPDDDRDPSACQPALHE
ncbi:FtsK/SpoIIIE domain-containing protein [Jonesia quinghaiensis]|uniref:FtsK/SpoIIIE domain-containing protein n=1 Tax=Jonesia quinghaiensis TaxID=262806 RepID=UPI00048EDB05|nr:FtsK/SpoIIIE domain-containing protein [Jonesia quinghaiensis]